MSDTRASILANQEGLADVTGQAGVEEGVSAGKEKNTRQIIGNQSRQGQAWAVVGVGDTSGFVSRRKALGDFRLNPNRLCYIVLEEVPWPLVCHTT